MMPLLILLACLCMSLTSASYTPEALKDQILDLPGLKTLLGFNMFAGYIPVSKTKQIFYMYFESQSSPPTDPVTLWTNGGPGCSGLLGLFTEQGPFSVNEDMTLQPNEFSWNKISNMLFVEQPAGVGFSYSPDSSDYKTGDDQSAVDNYQLIVNFLKRFPERAPNDFYITSESYGGHYMPQLAKEIVTRNTDNKINFKGFAVGNPYTDAFTNKIAQYEAYYYHGLLPEPLYKRWADKCSAPSLKNFVNCTYLEAGLTEIVGKGVNPYALDYPVCAADALSTQARTLLDFSNRDNDSLNMKMSMKMKMELGLEYEPCATDYMTSYLNTAEVKEAIHAKTDVTWGACSRAISYKTSDRERKIFPYYNYLVDGGYKLKILVYSGDDDAVCANSGTQSWIWDLGYESEGYASGEYWKPWSVNGLFAGYVTKMKDKKGGDALTFATVHGAGHEVPTYKPEAALLLFKNYVEGVF